MKYFLLALFAFFAYTVASYAADTVAPAPAATPDAAPAADTADAPRTLFQLSYSDAESAISNALSEKNAGSKIAATIIGRKTGPLFSYSKPVSVEIHSLQYDKSTSRWSANMMVLSGHDVVTAMPLAGRFDEMVEIPVLRHEMHNGEVIKAIDIEVRDFPINRTRSETITDISDLLGKSPAHVVSSDPPVRNLEVIAPAIVKKNGIVKIRYITPSMEISTTGQAMADGAKGETIAVRNTASKKIVEAIVADENTVTILPENNTQASQMTGASYAAN